MDGCTSQIEIGIQAPMRGDGKLLKAKRRERHWSRERLSRKVGISAKTVENHEKGKHPIDHEATVRYAQALECSPRELCESDDDQGRPETPPKAAKLEPHIAPGVPEPIYNLTNANPSLAPITTDEREHLTRHLGDPLLRDGNPLDLEIILLAYRLHRDLTAEAESKHREALRRKRRMTRKGVSPAKTGSPELAR